MPRRRWRAMIRPVQEDAAMRRNLWTVLLVALFAGALAADLVILKDGREFSGRVLQNDGKMVAIEMPRGVLYVPVSEIAAIIDEPSTIDLYEAKRREAVTAADWEALVAWCEANEYPAQEAKKALRSARVAEIRKEHPLDWCRSCGAETVIDCATCVGAGSLREHCKSCNEDHKVACATCVHSPGQKICAACAGAGTMDRGCRKCKSVGQVRCGTCEGDGIRSCSNCRGSGVVPDRVPIKLLVNGQLVEGWQEVYVTCTVCEGRRRVYCGVCERSGRTVCATCKGGGSVKEPCSSCRGDPIKKCPGCRGRVMVDCGQCKGKGHFSVACDGCDAKGQLTCPHCEGRGWKRQ